MPQIVVEETPFSILGRAGREVTDAKRAREMYALDKQQAEFELATAKQEQARKIESEDAYKQGAQWAVKNMGGFESPLQQQSKMIGQAQADPNQPGYKGRGAFQIQTKAQEEFAQHEKQKIQEAQAIVSRMHPQHAQAFMQEVELERSEERILFEANRLTGDFERAIGNEVFGQDEAAIGAVQQMLEQVKTIDARDQSAPKMLDAARQMLNKAIDAKAESDATGEYKMESDARAQQRIRGLVEAGGLDGPGLVNAKAALAKYRAVPVHTREDAIKYTYDLEDEITKEQMESTRRAREGATRDQARANPAKAVDDATEAEYGAERDRMAVGVRAEEEEPPTDEEMNARIVARLRRQGVPEEAFKHLLPQPTDIQRLKQQWSQMTKGARAKRQAEIAKLPGISTIEKDPGKKARVYRFLADLKIQGKASAEVEQALAEKFKMKIDTIDMAELQRVQEGLQAEPQGRGRARQRQMEGGG